MKKFKVQQVIVYYGGSPIHDKIREPEIRQAKNAYRAAQNAMNTRGKLNSLERDGYGPIFVRDNGVIGYPSPPQNGVMVTPV